VSSYLLTFLVIVAACKDKAVIADTDQELLRSPEQLTRAPAMNVGKWASDYLASHKQLPIDLDAIRPSASPKEGSEDVTNDAWGRNLELIPSDSGFIVQSAGKDSIRGTADDIQYRVLRSGKEMWGRDGAQCLLPHGTKAALQPDQIGRASTLAAKQ
jgi:hypothetical protein